MNFVISRCQSVRVSEVLVSSPGDSPNTDGIHITESTNVVLQDCKIGTGFDTSSLLLSRFLWYKDDNWNRDKDQTIVLATSVSFKVAKTSQY